jgi:hypothetical protein
MRHLWHQFVDQFWAPMGRVGCRIHESHLTAVRWWFLSPYGTCGLSNPLVTCDSSSLMISKSLLLLGLSNLWVTRDSSSLIISESLGLFGLSNPCVTRDSTSLMFYESLPAVWAVEIMGHLWQQFVDYFWVHRAVWAVESMRHPWQQFVCILWVPRGCLGCRTHASSVTAIRWWFLSP